MDPRPPHLRRFAILPPCHPIPLLSHLEKRIFSFCYLHSSGEIAENVLPAPGKPGISLPSHAPWTVSRFSRRPYLPPQAGFWTSFAGPKRFSFRFLNFPKTHLSSVVRHRFGSQSFPFSDYRPGGVQSAECNWRNVISFNFSH